MTNDLSKKRETEYAFLEAHGIASMCSGHLIRKAVVGGLSEENARVQLAEARQRMATMTVAFKSIR